MDLVDFRGRKCDLIYLFVFVFFGIFNLRRLLFERRKDWMR